MADKNISKRKKRRYRRRLKTSVKIWSLVIIFILFMGSYIGIRVYQLKNYVNPFGDVGSADSVDDPIEVETVNVSASYNIFDVGDGESILMKCGDKEALVDTGSAESAADLVKKLEGKISGDLDYLVLTSPSEKRLGGVPAVLRKYNVKNCIHADYSSGDDKESELDLKLRGWFGGKSTKVITGESTSYDIADGVTMFIIKPEVSSSDLNDKSLVTYFKAGELSAIAFSDAGKEEIARALSGIDGSDVVVFPQFGQSQMVPRIKDSVYSNYYVASASKESGFPTPEISEIYYSTVYSTGKSGDITFNIEGMELTSSLDDQEYTDEEASTEDAASKEDEAASERAQEETVESGV